MSQMFFKIIGRQPVPVLKDAVGAVSLDAAITATGWSKQALTAIHEGVFPPADPDQWLTEEEAVEHAMMDWRSSPSKTILRHSDFGDLRDSELAVFLVLAQRRGLDPWRGQVYPLRRFDDRRGNGIALGVTIDTLRAIAHATGVYVGMDAPVHEYAERDADPKIPVRTTQTIYKMVAGERQAFVGEALYCDSYSPGGLWDTKPHVCMWTVAETSALRRAFPTELGGMYSPLEFSQGQGERKSVQRNADAPNEETPHTYMGLHMAMMDLGLNKPPQREAVIGDFRLRFPGLLESDERSFYARVLNEVRQNPAKWGASATG
jgi:phage recombination protein Bet